MIILSNDKELMCLELTEIRKTNCVSCYRSTVDACRRINILDYTFAL